MIESLTTNEFNTFCNTLFSKFDRRTLMTKSIFFLLAHQGRNALQTKYTNNINKILKQILRSRQNKNEQKNNDDEDEENEEDIDILSVSNKKRKVKLTDLSSSLISSCGSYLEVSELTSFVKCNRHIYISIKSNSTSITKLGKKLNDEVRITDYMNHKFGTKKARIMRLNQFKSVKHLEIRTSDIDKITDNNKNPNGFIWNDLENLNLRYNRYQTEWVQNYRPLLEKQRDLKHLCITTQSKMNSFEILSLLTANKGIKYVDFNLGYHRYLNILKLNMRSKENESETIENINFSEHLPNLCGLSMDDYLFQNELIVLLKLLTQISPKLESYHVKLQSYQNDRTQNKQASLWEHYGTNFKFVNLKELCITIGSNTTPNSLQALQKMANKCKLHRLRVRIKNIYKMKMYEKYYQFIQNTLKTQNCLSSITFCGDNGYALYVIIQHLIVNSNKDKTRNDTFCNIKLSFDSWKVKEWNHVRESIENRLFELIDLLPKYVSNNFMIKFVNPWRKRKASDLPDFDGSGYWRFMEKVKNLDKSRYNLDETEIALLPECYSGKTP